MDSCVFKAYILCMEIKNSRYDALTLGVILSHPILSRRYPILSHCYPTVIPATAHRYLVASEITKR